MMDTVVPSTTIFTDPTTLDHCKEKEKKGIRLGKV